MENDRSTDQSEKMPAYCDKYVSEKINKLTKVIELSFEVSSNTDLESLLQKIVDSATELTKAEYGGLLVLTREGDQFEYFKVSGSFKPRGFPKGSSILGIPYKENKPIMLSDIRLHPRGGGTPKGHPPIRAFIGVPLSLREKTLGTLFVGNGPDRGIFYKEDKDLLMAFAVQAALAIGNVRLYEQARQLSRLEERKRIAQSLHETVLQYLFTVGLEVEKCLEQADPCLEKLSMIQHLIERASEELRSTIFALSFTSSVNMKGLPAILIDLIEEFKNTSGIRASLLLPRDLQEMPPAVSEAIFRIVREALSNVKKHARASAVAVTLSCDKQFVSITIQDNGRGLDMSSTQGLHFGLLTMKQVTSNANGEITILSNEDDEGTIVRATFPMLGGRKKTQ